jgi:adenylosuccinate synthase
VTAQIVLITGRTCTGKTNLGKLLRDSFGYSVISTGRILADVAKEQNQPVDRLSLQTLGDERDHQTGYKWVFDAVQQQETQMSPDTPIVVDNIRNAGQLEHFRKYRLRTVFHVHLYARSTELEERFCRKKAKRPGEAAAIYTQADLIKNESDIDSFKKDADVRINTSRTDSMDTLVRVAARLGLYSPPDFRCVDVLVGGQFGSEGKGHIAA